MIIVFGHNDGGSLSTSDNGRTDCSGTGSETCSTVYDGVSEAYADLPGVFGERSQYVHGQRRQCAHL